MPTHTQHKGLAANRRQVLTLGAGSLGALALPGWAQAYPSKPIKWVVPYNAGGASDLVARLVGEALGNALGQRVVVENRPGAGGTVGTAVVASSPADGYTMVTADNGGLFNNWHLFDKLPYTPDSFEYVVPLMRAPLVLALGPGVPAGNFQQWVDWVKQNKGKVSYGTPGVGSPHHLAMATLDDRLGLGMQHVPYRGDSAAVVDLVGGVLPCMLMGVATARQHTKDGKLKFVAMNWPTRLSSMPEVPTLEEVGVRNFEVSAEQGILMPVGTPREVVERINKEVLAIMNSAPVRERLETVGVYPPISRSPEECRAYVRRQAAAAGETIRKNGITIN